MLYEDCLKRCEFALYTIRYVEKKRLVERQSIVLRDKRTKLIIQFTDFADNMIYSIFSDTYAYRTREGDLLTVCQFLNYVFMTKYDKYRITSIYDLKMKMFQDFLDDYARSYIHFSNGERHPSKQSIHNKRSAVSIFGEMLCYYEKEKMHYLKGGQFIRRIAFKDNLSTRQTNQYRLKVTYFSDRKEELQHLQRDMPISLAKRFLDMAEIYCPELCFPIALQLYCGLREGEVCNVRQRNSIYGPGIIMTTQKVRKNMDSYDITPIAMQIDLRNEYPLRSDYTSVGRIKKERLVNVYSPFLEIIYRYYKKHLELISEAPCEDTMPMFLNKRKTGTGICMAITKQNYTERVIKLFYKYVLPSCEDDPDPALSTFFLTMREHSFGLHAFRHWFTVYLLYCGVDDIATLMNLRGDTSPESSRTYLMNKGVLLDLRKEASEKLGHMIKGGASVV